MSDEIIRPIDVMNYLFTPEFIKKWRASEEMTRVSHHFMKNQIKNAEKYRWHETGSTAEQFVARMDAGGMDKVFIAGLKMYSYLNHGFIANATAEQVHEQVKQFPDRLVGIVGYNPLRISESLEEIERAVRKYGFKGIYVHPHGFGINMDDRKMYPMYAKASELGVPVILQTGHSLELMPSEPGRPIHLDHVAIDFPKLRLVGSHTAWPWCEEMIAMAWKHENVYMDISAHPPKYVDKSVVQFMNTRGRDKVLFGTNNFPFEFTEWKTQFMALGLKEETNRKVLRENAIRVFELE